MSVYEYLMKRIGEEVFVHAALFDPERTMPEKVGRAAEILEYTDLFLVGGSLRIYPSLLDETIKAIKEVTDKPVVLFPGNVHVISKYADAIFFMSLLNSNNPYWITQAQAIAAPYIKEIGIETISVAYLIVEPGGAVGWVGNANLIPRKKPEIAMLYSLAAQYFGFKFTYLEGGSGIAEPIPKEFVRFVASNIDIPLIVGGGIRKLGHFKRMIEAGAKIIVTGSIVEKDPERVNLIVKEAKTFAKSLQ